jgi:Zn-dependent peptidase ImmA (M78 family)
MIEDIASEVRRFWGLGSNPIVNLVGLLEQHCTIISRDYMDAQSLDALSLWGSVEGVPYIVLNADKQSAIRSRTDAAHELGHLILHRKIQRNQLSKAEEFKLVEDQAFRFACAFLLPSERFAEDVYALSLDALRALQPKWKISLGMKIKRSEGLGLINGEQAK